MTENTVFPGLMSIGAGILIIVIRLQRWKWFMDHYKVRGSEKLLGVKGADMLYFLSGLALIILGVLLILGVL